MTEYPRKCTIQEAIDCMLAGGKVSAKHKSDPNDYWSHFKSVYGYDADNYEYRIDAPVPPVPSVAYSTATAIAELFEHKPGEVEFTGEHSVYSQLTLFLCNTKTVQIRNWDGAIMNCIPNTTWIRKAIKPNKSAKPKPVEAVTTIYPQGEPSLIVGDIKEMRRYWEGPIRITYTVEAID